MSPDVLLFALLAAVSGAVLAVAANRDRLRALRSQFKAQREALAASIDRAQELEREADRLRRVLDGVEDGILAVSPEQTVVLANPAALALLDLHDDPADQLLVEVVPAPEVVDLLAAAREGVASHIEIDLGGRSLDVGARPCGRGTLISLRDVTDLRRLERVRRDFVANVSHELRTPVTVISTHAETLLESALEDPAHARRFVEGIARHSQRLTRLVSDLLDLSRIEAGRHGLDLGDLDVAEIARAAAAGLVASAETRGVTLTVEAPDQLSGTGDAAALDQVLFNLIDNATKYTPAGGAVLVRASATSHGGVRVEVVDDGPGVAPEHRGRLFERFYRVDKGRSRDAGGTGLGLSIVKHLVESMGGEAGYEAREPTGSIFWVDLRGRP